MQSLIYIIDDEQDICNLVCNELEVYGFESKAINTGKEALSAIKERVPALCIVDLGLPDMDGLSLVKKLCDTPNMGVLILSGRSGLPDKVLGLELGADDYIAKPFEIRELIARVNSLLRRLESINVDHLEQIEHSINNKRCAKFAHWSFNLDSLTLLSDSGDKHMLSSAESNLLNTLLKKPQQIVSRDQLLGDQTIPYDRSIDSRMSRLRRKIEEDSKNPKIIKTVYGAGYMFSVPVEWKSSEP